MSEYFSPEFFAGNRARLRELFTGTAPIVMTANGFLQRSADETYPFRQDSNFWYVTGVQDPNVILVMDKGKEYLIVPELSHARIMFDGAINADLIAQTSGIREVLSEKEGWKKLSSRLKRASSVAVLAPAPSYIDYFGMYTSPARRRLIRELKKHNPELTLLDLKQHLQRMRMRKQPVEIEAITRAVAITSDAMKKVEKKFRKGSYQNEFEVELDLTKHFWQAGAKGHGFEPIVASGAKSTRIHPESNNGPIRNDQSLLLDIGAEFEQYAADISRCWINEPSKRFSMVYESVKEAADYAISCLKPGVVLNEYEKQVEQFMGEKLRALGLIKTIEPDSVRHYFPHRTSHFLGIDVHDFGDYEYRLEPGVVLAVEPGIYIPEEGIGIRIEDDVLITSEGRINLSADLPRGLS